ncbi:MAG TPA: RNA polymerase sigma factor [Symbiobacteriaceae bacterium]|nr:RNA polymerase sigma factor [Symbiobacteriaceae bacterium]
MADGEFYRLEGLADPGALSENEPLVMAWDGQSLDWLDYILARPTRRDGHAEGGGSVPRGVSYLPRPESGGGRTSSEDTILIRRLTAGDEEALGTLMDRYGGALLHFAHRLVGDLHLAEEIYQDTMLKAWQQAGTFRMEGHLKAWLFRVARNNAIDYMRRKRVSTEEYSPSLETADEAGQPERLMEQAWVSTEMLRALDDLPDVYREVISLRFFHQLCYQEIAEIMNIPLGTVKSRLSYALGRLTKILREKGINPAFLEME